MTHTGNFAFLVSLLILAPMGALAADVSPTIDYNPQISLKSNLSGEQLVRSFLSSDAKGAGLVKGAALELVQVQGSLLDTHYRFKQVLNGLDVVGGEIIVSLAADGQTISRTFARVYSTDRIAVKKALLQIKEENAFDAAWQNIKAHGELLEAPTAKLSYFPINGELHLAYVTNISVNAPFGYWQQVVDAETGKVIDISDRRLERVKTSFIKNTQFTGSVSDRKVAFAAYDSKAANKSEASLLGTMSVVSGTGVVFDPDPRTTLNDNALEDSSPVTAFEHAYFTKDLLEISQVGGVYRLTGPWVTIADFESPNTAPSTSTTGNWTAKRGTNSFNDVMTYFHLDQSQRYMQSLGFNGTRGIQHASISVDTDGLNGDDNSHFIPSSNKLAFGHGCVDDNEDADVILHEFGHAIQSSINHNWNGGDTGAMGEGFGDYWGASYSYRTPNGAHFFPNQIYSWDGHGTSDACWPGRVLDATTARYVAGTTYQAHTPIPGGHQSDELWSTPLFQSLVTLTSMGVPHEEVDKIILESHFGLGGGITMPAMARATVATASRLFPTGQHAEVFTAKFRAMGILP